MPYTAHQKHLWPSCFREVLSQNTQIHLLQKNPLWRYTWLGGTLLCHNEEKNFSEGLGAPENNSNKEKRALLSGRQHPAEEQDQALAGTSPFVGAILPFTGNDQPHLDTWGCILVSLLNKRCFLLILINLLDTTSLSADQRPGRGMWGGQPPFPLGREKPVGQAGGRGHCRQQGRRLGWGDWTQPDLSPDLWIHSPCFWQKI